jgi:hypothetical protein
VRSSTDWGELSACERTAREAADAKAEQWSAHPSSLLEALALLQSGRGVVAEEEVKESEEEELPPAEARSYTSSAAEEAGGTVEAGAST